MGGELAEKLRGSWVERVSGEDDLFIKAFIYEERGDYREAAHYYLEDAQKLEEEGEHRLAAVGYASAARCFELAGDRDSARHCYSESSRLFSGFNSRALLRRAAMYRERVLKFSSRELEKPSRLREKQP
ncbi:hypothetical protein B6U84_04940 [Candidatus Bathyarchaeota archaeon ex4484_40]|nr:MAG: hypothetical protein B6U84_04940 [Candidatus Bathyarchaeota archaeon ex4484_40]